MRTKGFVVVVVVLYESAILTQEKCGIQDSSICCIF